MVCLHATNSLTCRLQSRTACHRLGSRLTYSSFFRNEEKLRQGASLGRAGDNGSQFRRDRDRLRQRLTRLMLTAACRSLGVTCDRWQLRGRHERQRWLVAVWGSLARGRDDAWGGKYTAGRWNNIHGSIFHLLGGKVTLMFERLPAKGWSFPM